MDNKQQTAVEWLVEKLASLTFEYMEGFISKREYDQLSKGVIRQAKEMEKQRMIEFAQSYAVIHCMGDITKNAYEYYNETYK